jgi:hypothetical protein
VSFRGCVVAAASFIYRFHFSYHINFRSMLHRLGPWPLEQDAGQLPTR